MQFLAFVIGVALVSGAALPEHSSVEQQSVDGDFDPHPNYQFSYKVADDETGDYKSQTEVRDGDVVHGEYSLRDADGYLRSVHYTADSVNGFQAVVQRSLHSQEVQPEVLVKSVSTANLEATDASSVALRSSVEAAQGAQNVQVTQTVAQQPTTIVRTYQQQPNVVHAVPAAVHLTPTTHVIHHTAPTTTLLKTAVPAVPAAVVTTHHHHAPATVIKTPITHTLTAPQHHISYLHYH